MRPPPLCLLCGHLRTPREDPAAPCSACREPPPAVEWQSTESYKPGQRALLGGAGIAGGAIVALFAALLVRGIVRAPGDDVIIKSLLVLVVACISGFLFWGGGYTLLVRGYRFESKDGRVYGSVTTLGGRIERAFGLSFALRPLDLGSVPGARSLTSLAARALDEVKIDGSRPIQVTGEAAPALAAILGMAARGEIELLAGEPRRFWVGPKPDHLSQVRNHIWLRARHGAAPDLPFENRFLSHLAALSGAPLREPGESGYRVAAMVDDRDEPPIPLDDVLMRLGEESDAAGTSLEEHVTALLGPAREEPAAPAVSRTLVAAASVDEEAAFAIASDVVEWMNAW